MLWMMKGLRSKDDEKCLATNARCSRWAGSQEKDGILIAEVRSLLQ